MYIYTVYVAALVAATVLMQCPRHNGAGCDKINCQINRDLIVCCVMSA